MKRLFNFFRDYILEYLLIVLVFAGVVFLAFAKGSFAEPNSRLGTAYVKKIFDDSYVHKIEVEIKEDDYSDLITNPREKNKYNTAVKIDGEEFRDVAFSVRGNGSLTAALAEREERGPTNVRYSYNLNFKKFGKENSYYGLDKLVLNSLYYEESYLRSYLAFRIAAASGVETPLTSFTQLFINGELKGVYLAIEGIDQSFLRRIGADKDAAVFHPVPYDIDWDRRYEDEKYLSEGETIDVASNPLKNDYDFGGTNLMYAGDSKDDYPAIFENSATKFSKLDEETIISGIKTLHTGVGAEDYWDMNALFNYFASTALVVNSDSYLGPYAQNYYLKVSNGKLSMIPWDYDSSFRAFGYGELSPEKEAIVWTIDSPVFYTDESGRPLWLLIKENPEYLEKYHDTIQRVLDSYFLNGTALADLAAADKLIRPYVEADPNRRYSLEEYDEEVGNLKSYVLLRADSVQKQLWGLIPRTRDESSFKYSSSLLPSNFAE